MSKPITVDDIAAVVGTGPRTTRRLIREGQLPGRFDGRNFICTPGEFDRWKRGEWVPKPNPVNVTSFKHSRNTAKSA